MTLFKQLWMEVHTYNVFPNGMFKQHVSEIVYKFSLGNNNIKDPIISADVSELGFLS